MLLLIWSCNGDNGGGSVPPPPSSESVLHGSFAGKFDRFSRGERYSGPIATEWCDTVWRNDRVSRQLVLWTEQEVVGSLSLLATSLSDGYRTIDAEHVRLRQVDYVAGDARALTCGEQTSRTTARIGDALSEKNVTRLTSADPLKVWITIDIPASTPPGIYTGAIEVRQNGVAEQVFDVKMVVAPHVLPEPKEWAFHLDIWQFPFQLSQLCASSGTRIEPFSTAWFQLMEPFYALLADAGQRAVTAYIKDGAFNRGQTMIDWSREADGTWLFDYSKFDAFVEFMFALGIDRQIDCFSLAGWNDCIGYTDAADGSYKYMDLPVLSEEYAGIWSAFLDDFRHHLASKGWMDRAVLYMDETRQEEMGRIVEVIRTNGSNWKLGLAGGEIDAAVERELYDYSTIIGYNRKATNNVRATFYTSCSQRCPNNYVTAETSSAEMTWMAWHAAAKGFDGYVRWAYDYWTQSDPLDVRDGTNPAGDFNMIYRTDNSMYSEPVSSIRFEMLREGIADYEKVRILGVDKFRSVLSAFADSAAPDARRHVIDAQSALKQASMN